jgi:Holliday junction resolvase RusA-like endonuclease
MDADEGEVDEMDFFCPVIPPTTTAQMHQVSIVKGKPHFYDPPEVQKARAKLLSAICEILKCGE